MSSASEQVVRGAGGRSRQPWIFLGCPAPGRPQQLLVSAEENSEGTLGFTAMVVGSPQGQKTSGLCLLMGACPCLGTRPIGMPGWRSMDMHGHVQG